MSHIQTYIADLQRVIAQLDTHAIDAVVGCIEAAYLRDARIFVCGNGGSAATASHFATDLCKGTTFNLENHLKALTAKPARPINDTDGAADGGRTPRLSPDVVSEVRRIRAMALTDNMALMTAWANDTAYEHVFAEQVRALAGRGDVLILISGSGNSPNVLRAAAQAKAQQVTTIGFTGFQGGKLAPAVEYNINVPADCIEQVEDVHMSVCHMIATNVRALIRAYYTARAANVGYYDAP